MKQARRGMREGEGKKGGERWDGSTYVGGSGRWERGGEQHRKGTIKDGGGRTRERYY